MTKNRLGKQLELVKKATARVCWLAMHEQLFCCDICAEVKVGDVRYEQIGLDWGSKVIFSVVCRECFRRWNQ